MVDWKTMGSPTCRYYADLRLKQLIRPPSGIMKARKKEIKEVPVADLGVDIPRLKVLKMEPPKKEAGKKWRPCRNCSTFCT